MQILLGAQETIIKINSKTIKIDYIQHFIHEHFTNVIITNKSLYIPTSRKNNHYRIFLLKWLYALYIKKKKNNVSQFKEILLKREYKAIKIILSQEITHKIIWNILDEKNIALSIEPYNEKIIVMLKTYFTTSLHVNNTYISLHVNTVEEKERLKKLLANLHFFRIKVTHIFNKQEMASFVKTPDTKEKRLQNPLQKAHTILGSFPEDDASMLKKRYKKLAKKYHPDKVDIQDNKNVVLYTQKFQNILQAYEILLEQVS